MAKKPKKPDRPSVSADQIVRLLAERHEEDVFVPECKDGPTQGASHLRMDAWAMAKSWANPRAVAYEVKVARSDFLGDNKWRGYLGYCNEFYFVCPPDVIHEGELPPEAGLVHVTANGGKLFTKKKAPYREVQVPDSLYRYVLMSRVKIVRHMYEAGNEWSMRDYWRSWLEQKEEDRELGHVVGKRIGERIKQRIKDADTENRRNAEKIVQFEGLMKFLRSIGMDPDHEYPHQYRVRNRLDELRRVVPMEVRGAIFSLTKQLQDTCYHIEQAEKKEREAA